MYETEWKFVFYFMFSLIILCLAFFAMDLYKIILNNNIKEMQINYVKTVCPVWYNVIIESTQDKVTSSCSK